ncbi:MAG TPA: carboxypeptidase-like regulatory domain-containing protein, partial [Abditibacteriaceae bacterium]
AIWDIFTKSTDAAGRWTFDFFAPGQSASIELVDARFVRLSSETDLPATGSISAKPFVARIGARLEGRVVDENGKPLSGVRVYASTENPASASWDDAITSADGNYHITRLGTGIFKVGVYEKRDAERVGAPRLAVRAEEGKTNKVAELVMTPGALVEGKVTDSNTAAPIAGVRISASGSSTRTSADGTYRARAVPGEVQVYVMGKPQNYAYPKLGSPSNLMKFPLAEGDTKRIDFALDPLLPLAGRAVDEQGLPAAGATIMVGRNWDHRAGVVGADGAFSVAGLEPGEVTFVARGEWIVVKPDKVTIPVKDPIVVTLRRSAIVPVVGRVVDDEGAPVAEAEVAVQESIRIGTEDMGGMSTSTAGNVRTDAQGQWQWTPSRADAELSVKVKKGGYRFVSGGTLTKRKEIMGVNGRLVPNARTEWVATDSVLQKLDAQLSGRVLDAAGVPVIGAEVWMPGGETSATSGADGAWKLTGLPAGENEVFAATRKQFGVLKVQPNSALPLVITLQTPLASPPDFKTVRSLLQELVKEEKGDSAIAPISMLAITDPDTALVLASQLNAGARETAIATSLRAFVQHDPKGARERLPDLLGALPAPLAGIEGLTLAAQIASFESDEARAIFDRERAKLQPLDANNRTPAYMRAALAAVAARLNLPEANTLADETLAALVKQYGVNDVYHALDAAIERLAMGGGAFAERALEKIPVARRSRAAYRAVIVLSHFDLDGARRLLDLIPGWTQPDNNGQMKEIDAFAQGALAVIPRLGRVDPAAALALARRVKSDGFEAQALASAAWWQPRAEAKKLLREAYEMPDGFPMVSIARFLIARRASVLDAALGEEMVLEAEKYFQSLENPQVYTMVPAELSWILARTQPGRARLLLERSWEMAKHEAWWSRQDIAFAMVKIDWQRALEMAKSLGTSAPEGLNTRPERRLPLLMIQWALAPSQLREMVSFERAKDSSMAFRGEDF